jgi:hypothetical protein
MEVYIESGQSTLDMIIELANTALIFLILMLSFAFAHPIWVIIIVLLLGFTVFEKFTTR